MLNISESINVRRINGSVQRGGWQVDFTVLSDTDLIAVNQRIHLSWQGIFGDVVRPSLAAFTGYALPSRFQFDVAKSQTTVVAQTSDGFLRNGWLQGLGLADRDAVARDHYHQWDSVTGVGVRMTMGRIVKHILGYYDEVGVPPATNPDWVAHTNMVFHAIQNPAGWLSLDNVMELPFDPDTRPDGSMRVDRFIVRETDNLWSRLQEIASNEFFFIYFTKTDVLNYRRHPMYATVLPAPVMTFDEDFCIVPPTVTWRTQPTYQLKLHAVTDEGDTLHSTYPLGAKVNYVTNPEFEVNIDDWNPLDINSTIVHSVAFAHEGTGSMRVTIAGMNDGGAYTDDMSMSTPDQRFTTLTGSAWVYQVAGGASLRVIIHDLTNGDATPGTPVVLAPGVWTQLTASHAIGNAPCYDARLTIETSVMGAIQFYIDTVSLNPPALAVFGTKQEISRIRCNDQDTLDAWCQRHFLFLNRDCTVRWRVPGLCGLLFELMDRIEITYSGTDQNGVHIDWVSKRFWIHEIDVVPDSKHFTGQTTFTLEAENVVG